MTRLSSGISENPLVSSSIRRPMYGAPAVRNRTSSAPSRSPAVGDLAVVEETPDARELPLDVRRQEAPLPGERKDRLDDGEPAREELGRLLTERSKRLAEQLLSGRELDGREVVPDPLERLGVSCGGKTGAFQTTEELAQRLGLLAGRVQVGGQAADPVERLLPGGERLGVDLEAQCLAGAVHRGEDLARVPPETAGLYEPGTDGIEEARDDADDGLLGDRPRLLQDPRDLVRGRRPYRAEELPDLGETFRRVDLVLAQRLQGRAERLEGRGDPRSEGLADLPARGLDRLDGLLPVDRSGLGVGPEGALERVVRKPEVPRRGEERGPVGARRVASCGRLGDLVRKKVVDLLDRLRYAASPQRLERGLDPIVERGETLGGLARPLCEPLGPALQRGRERRLAFVERLEQARQRRERGGPLPVRPRADGLGDQLLGVPGQRHAVLPHPLSEVRELRATGVEAERGRAP